MKANLFIIGLPNGIAEKLVLKLSNLNSVYINFDGAGYFGRDIYKEIHKYSFTQKPSKKQYNNSFKKNKDHQLRVDYSEWLILSKKAIRQIKHYNKDAKIIIVLPEKFFIEYKVFRFNQDVGREKKRMTFAKALELENKRSQNKKIPFGECKYHFLYQSIWGNPEPHVLRWKKAFKDNLFVFDMKQGFDVEFFRLCTQFLNINDFDIDGEDKLLLGFIGLCNLHCDWKLSRPKKIYWYVTNKLKKAFRELRE